MFSIVVPVTIKAYRLIIYDRDADYLIFSPKGEQINNRHPMDLGRILLYPRNKRLTAAEAAEQFKAAKMIRSIDKPVGDLAISRLTSEYPESVQTEQKVEAQKKCGATGCGNNFRGVKVADARGKQADADLIFDDASKRVIVRVADRDLVIIPYDQFDKASYEYTKKHRITQGAVVMVASLGAGAVVMMTSSKSHWLYIDYHDQNVPKVVVLRMDNKAYKHITAAVTAHTGKEVEDLGKADKKSKQDKSKDP